jgi:DNA-binding LytR/AlgR family response regulator
VGRVVYLIRKPIREMADELNPDCFVQIHRSTIVQLFHHM